MPHTQSRLGNGVAFAAVLAIPLFLVAPSARASAVYWSDHNNGAIYCIDGPGAPQRVVVPDAGRPWGLAIDPVRNHLYWADNDPATAEKILRVNLDGSGRTVVLAEEPRSGGGTQFVQDLALDLVSGFVYYTQGNTPTISRVRTDGTGDEVLVRGRLNGPSDVKLDVANGYMYWTEILSTRSEIYRSRLDGSDARLLFGDVGFYSDLAIAPGRRHHGSDYDGEYLYFADTHSQRQAIRRIPVEGGTEAEAVLHQDGLEPSGIEIDPHGRWLYFSHGRRPGIWRVGLDGRQLRELTEPEDFPYFPYTIDLTLEHTALFAAAAAVPEPAALAAVALACLAVLRPARPRPETPRAVRK